MKTCSYCGKEYPDETKACAIDGYLLGGGGAPEPPALQEAIRSSAPVTATVASPRLAAERNIRHGGFWLLGGIVVTGLTYANAAGSPGGGTYFIAWGAIIFGGIQFLNGLSGLRESSADSSVRAPTAADVLNVATASGIWTCAACGELSESQFTRCWKCQIPRGDPAETAGSTSTNNPDNGSPESISAIFNFRAVGERWGTAGQPTEAQFRSVREAGFEAVINLALPTSDNALPQEGSIVTGLGMSYVHIPVDFKAPTPENFRAFSAMMDAFEGRNVFVHCAANMRVSAFVFLYRVLRQGVARSEAEADLQAIWQPDEIWNQFIQNQLAGGGP